MNFKITTLVLLGLQVVAAVINAFNKLLKNQMPV